MNSHIKIERKKQVLSRIPFSKATLHRYINLGKFPPSIPLGARSVGFLTHEVDAFIAALATDQDLETLVDTLMEERRHLISTPLFHHKSPPSNYSNVPSKESK
ncbi:helix-turn-helix transcriptional regulator [Vibrio sp. 10N.222.49.A3]|uniref:helix-turn-helix transcriptional regulator n=1 Tax=Vibrio sp. 10N.222.49.A3 TaxID=3229611 RepID=UPI00354DED08